MNIFCFIRTAISASTLVLILLWTSFVRAEEDPLADIYKLPVWIDQVSRVCPWKSAAGEGYIRLIRVEKDSRHGLYLQWIRKGIAGSPTQATSTVLVEELEKDYAVRLQMPKARLTPNACRLSSVGESISNERRYEFDFILKGPGDYQLEITHLLEGGL